VDSPGACAQFLFGRSHGRSCTTAHRPPKRATNTFFTTVATNNDVSPKQRGRCGGSPLATCRRGFACGPPDRQRQLFRCYVSRTGNRDVVVKCVASLRRDGETTTQTVARRGAKTKCLKRVFQEYEIQTYIKHLSCFCSKSSACRARMLWCVHDIRFLPFKRGASSNTGLWRYFTWARPYPPTVLIHTYFCCCFCFHRRLENVTLMLDSCKYEKAWYVHSRPAWCAVFTTADFEVRIYRVRVCATSILFPNFHSVS